MQWYDITCNLAIVHFFNMYLLIASKVDFECLKNYEVKFTYYVVITLGKDTRIPE